MDERRHTRYRGVASHSLANHILAGCVPGIVLLVIAAAAIVVERDPGHGAVTSHGWRNSPPVSPPLFGRCAGLGKVTGVIQRWPSCVRENESDWIAGPWAPAKGKVLREPIW